MQSSYASIWLKNNYRYAEVKILDNDIEINEEKFIKFVLNNGHTKLVNYSTVASIEFYNIEGESL